MTCTFCQLTPARIGADRCHTCAGLHIVRLPRAAQEALAAIRARHDGLTTDGAIAAALILQDRAERGDL
jgi:hypothetical protein